MDAIGASLNQTGVNSSRSCAVNDSVDRQMYPAAYSLFFIVGFPANCLSLVVAWVLMRKGNSLAVYLVNLSISDLLYTVTLPVWIRLARRRPVGDTLCSLVAVVMLNSFYVGSGLLCCISVDRYLAVVYPMYFHGVREVRTSVVVSAAVWCAEALVHVVLLDHTGALWDFSSRRLCEERMPMAPADADQALTRVALGFLLPLLVMTFCFQQIMTALRGSASLLAEERRKIGLLLLLLLLTYLVSFVPYQAVMFLRAVLEPSDSDCTWARRLRDPYMVLVATTTLNSVLDPIIYCLISQSARVEMNRVLDKGRKLPLFRRVRVSVIRNNNNNNDSI